MTRKQDPLRLNSLIEESRRLKLEQSFEHAERYLERTITEDPNDRDALSALAVLLLEDAQYSKANNVTRRLTTLIANEGAEETPLRDRNDFDSLRQDNSFEDDISADLALSRQMAQREGLYSRLTATKGVSEAKDGKVEPSVARGARPIGNQAELSLEPSALSNNSREADELMPPIPLDSAVDQRTLGLADRIPISNESSDTHEHQARKFVPSIDQPELDLDDQMPISRRNEDDQDLYRQGIDIDSLADGLPDNDDDESVDEADDDTDWPDDLLQEKRGMGKKSVSNVPLELDQDYAEDAFSESPTPEELLSIPDAKSTRERAQEVALDLICEYGLGDEYRPVLTKIFSEYWWSRCKTSMREQLELAVSAKALDMARQLREHWAEHPEYHENISDYQRYYGYASLPWRLAIRLVDAYRQYPQVEEIVGFLEFLHGEWDTRHTLQRQFPSFYSMIKHIVERSESDCLDPSAVSNLFRKLED